MKTDQTPSPTSTASPTGGVPKSDSAAVDSAGVAGATAQGLAGSGNSTDNLLMYMGLQPKDVSGEGNLRPNEPQNTKHYMTLADARAQWYQYTQAQRLDFAREAYSLGYLTTSPTDIKGAQSVWEYAIEESANFLSAGHQDVDPTTVLHWNIGANKQALADRADAGPGSHTTSNPVNLLDKANVQAIATTALQNALGRNPTQAEINTFFNTIHEKQLADPGSTTTTRDAAGNVTAQVSTAGYTSDDANQYLQSQIQNDPEFAKFQGGTTYFNAAMSALGAIGGA